MSHAEISRAPVKAERWANQSDKEASQEIIIRSLRRKIANTERAHTSFYAIINDAADKGMTARAMVEAFLDFFPEAKR